MDKPILVTKSSLPPIEEYIELIQDIWESAWLTNMGRYHIELEAKLKKYLGVEELILLTNGHLAIELCLQALELTGEVITTPFSFASTTHAIVRAGLTPVFCDINEDDYTIDVDKIEALITERTSAILPVHVYGNICNVEKIDELAKKYNLKVIYDAAHTFGERYKGVGVGSLGDASIFSFHATKVYNTIEGGALSCADKALRKRMEYLKNFGITDKERVDFVGSNAKMSEFQAAMGLCNLKYIDEYILKRRHIVEEYNKGLKDVKGIKLNTYRADISYNYAYMPIYISEEYTLGRDELYDLLASYNIFARKYFYPCINAYACYKDRFDENATPIAKKISQGILTLPIYPDLDLSVVDKICNIIRKGK